MREIIVESDIIDAILEPHRDSFPSQQDFDGYKNHCLRGLNTILAMSEDEPDRREKLEIALAFHDLTVFPKQTLDYIEPSNALAMRYLDETGRSAWKEEIAAMIRNHHKITQYKGPYANLVEAFRRADWIDVTFGMLVFGLDRAWLRQVFAALPLYSLYPKTLGLMILRYVVTHPWKPLPNFRW